MKIYLASRYGRRLELCIYRAEIQELGHTVTSRWLQGDHQITDAGQPLGESGERAVEGGLEGDSGTNTEEANNLRRHFAHVDFDDVSNSDLLIAFTEPPRSEASRGGRHVEMGLALGMMKQVWVVGYRENVFCWHEDVRFFPEFGYALDRLRDPVLG